MAASPVALPDAVRRFLLGERRHAVVATIGADGAPHQAVAWYFLRGDTLVIHSREGRRWPRDLCRDPRVSIAVEEGYDWVGIGGRAEVVEDQAQAQADIAEMARRYEPPDVAERSIARFRRERRVSFLVHPESVHVHFDSED